jgi:hypothetical protein
MDETTRTAVSVAEVPAEAPRLRYDDGQEAVQEELSSTRRTARVVGMLVLGGYLTYCRGTTSRVGLGTTSRVGLGRVIMSWVHLRRRG